MYKLVAVIIILRDVMIKNYQLHDSSSHAKLWTYPRHGRCVDAKTTGSFCVRAATTNDQQKMLFGFRDKRLEEMSIQTRRLFVLKKILV